MRRWMATVRISEDGTDCLFGDDVHVVVTAEDEGEATHIAERWGEGTACDRYGGSGYVEDVRLEDMPRTEEEWLKYLPETNAEEGLDDEFDPEEE